MLKLKDTTIDAPYNTTKPMQTLLLKFLIKQCGNKVLHSWLLGVELKCLFKTHLACERNILIMIYFEVILNIKQTVPISKRNRYDWVGFSLVIHLKK